MEINNQNSVRPESSQPSFLLKNKLMKLSERLTAEPYSVPKKGLKTQGVIREGQADGFSYSILARNSFATNGRDVSSLNLDLTIKLPPGFESFEDNKFYFAATKVGSKEPEAKMLLSLKKTDSGNILEHNAHLPVYLSQKYHFSIFEKEDTNGEGGGERINTSDPNGGGSLVRLKREIHQPVPQFQQQSVQTQSLTV